MIILCGKTASGKDTIAKKLVEKGMSRLVTYTTRPMRPGEENGIDYWFFSDSQFKTLEKEGVFLETTSYTVVDGQTWYYGTPVLGLTENKVLIMNPEGVKKIKKYKSLIPVIFYLEVSDEAIKERLKIRGDNAAESDRRIKADDEDFSDIENYCDFKIYNDVVSPDETADLIYKLYGEMTNGK